MAKANTSNVAKGTAYEKFVQAIYQTLLNESEMKDVTVEHNKTDLPGNSGCCHQLDIYWEFTVAGHRYQTAIECKDFASQVDIGRVRNFNGVLIDYPKLKGIFVTTNGFQAGAKRYGDFYGIDLLEVREPTQADWSGRIKDININFIIVNVEILSLTPNPAQDYLDGLDDSSSQFLGFSGTNYDTFIVDSEGAHVASIEDIRARIPIDGTDVEEEEETLGFHGCYVRVDQGEPVPIDSVTVRYKVKIDFETVKILGQKVARAIIKNVESGEFRFLRKAESNVDEA